MSFKFYIYTNVNVSDKVYEQYNDEQQLSPIRDNQLNQDASVMLADHKERWY